MNIKTIIKEGYVHWKDVKRAIKYHYPTDKSNYEELFYDLGKMRCKKVSEGEFITIHGGFDYTADWFKEKGLVYEMIIDESKDKDIGEYYSVGLRVEGEDENYGVSFIPWGKMINYPIDVDTFRHFTMVDIVAHFIWEITFYGPEKKSIQEGKDLQKTIKKIKKESKKKK